MLDCSAIDPSFALIANHDLVITEWNMRQAGRLWVSGSRYGFPACPLSSQGSTEERIPPVLVAVEQLFR
jgi:hypothetical protein